MHSFIILINNDSGKGWNRSGGGVGLSIIAPGRGGDERICDLIGSHRKRGAVAMISLFTICQHLGTGLWYFTPTQ